MLKSILSFKFIACIIVIITYTSFITVISSAKTVAKTQAPCPKPTTYFEEHVQSVKIQSYCVISSNFNFPQINQDLPQGFSQVKKHYKTRLNIPEAKID